MMPHDHTSHRASYGAPTSISGATHCRYFFRVVTGATTLIGSRNTVDEAVLLSIVVHALFLTTKAVTFIEKRTKLCSVALMSFIVNDSHSFEISHLC